MAFNSFVWGLYKDSEEGKAALSKDIAEFADYFGSFEGGPFDLNFPIFELVDGEIDEDQELKRDWFDLRELIKDYALECNTTSIEDAEELFKTISDEGIEWRFEYKGKDSALSFGGGRIHSSLYEEIYSFIEGMSAGLHDAYPDYFAPYFFGSRFDQFEKICHAFSITLPEVPGKLKKRERALYYAHINRELYKFRIKHNLSPRELVAFLYDFAPKNILKNEETEADLPPASRVWFIIGGVGDGDFDKLDAIDSESMLLWQGNLEMRKGDIALMWCVSPRSYLHSVWRALDDGYNDPFFYFYAMTRIGKPVKITPIPFADFSNHPFLSSRPAVRARFQGRGGSPFTLEEYAAIVEILQKKGFDTSLLPSPPEAEVLSDVALQSERDVETVFVEPFLRSIGLTEKDWIRQFPLRMGRGQRNYPDYILGGDATPGDERAFAIIECKLHIETKKELKDAFVQAQSYALRLQANVLVLAASRGIWVFQRRKDGFSIDHFLFKTWKELSHPDTLHQISLIIGKRKIETVMR